MSLDLIMSLLLLGGSIILIDNVRKLLQSKKVQGVSVLPSIYFSIQALFNIYFFIVISNPISATASVFIFFINAVWLSLAFKYRNN